MKDDSDYRSLFEKPDWIKKLCLRCQKDFWLAPAQAPHIKFCSDGCRHESPLVRLLKNATTNEQGCVLFAGAKNIDGYGTIKWKGKQWRANRLSWHLQRGPIPEGMDVLHTCRKCPQCINIEHLYLGTVRENTDDRMEQGHQVCGQNHPKADLTPEQVKEIYAAKGTMKLREAVEKFGSSISTISLIWRGQHWGSNLGVDNDPDPVVTQRN